MPYQSQIINQPGQKKKEILIFALSTCVWCQKTKKLLNELGLEYSYLDVDLLGDSDRDDAYEAMQKYSQSASFPTIIVDNGAIVITGYEVEKLKKLAV